MKSKPCVIEVGAHWTTDGVADLSVRCSTHDWEHYWESGTATLPDVNLLAHDHSRDVQRTVRLSVEERNRRRRL